MQANVFVPGHITGFFEIFLYDDPLYSGSRGCGVVLDKGVITRAEVMESDRLEIETFLNGTKTSCDVSKFAVYELLKNERKKYRIKIFHELQVPMMQGFGTSGAGALGAVLALNTALKLNLSLNQCAAIAHKSEVINQTGLGDVIAQVNGGVVMRIFPGPPGIGVIDKIPYDGYVVVLILGSGIKTKKVLSNCKMRKKINKVGGECMKLLLKKPTVDNFLRLSQFFSFNTGLITRKAKRVIEELQKYKIRASMVMLGNAIFSITEEPENLSELGYKCIIAKINNEGAKVGKLHFKD